MLFERLFVALAIHGKPLLGGEFLGELQREAVRIVELKGGTPREGGLSVLLERARDLVELALAGGERFFKTRLLSGQLIKHRRAVRLQFGIDMLVVIDHDFRQDTSVARLDTQQLGVAHGAADQATQHVVRTDVTGLDAAFGVAEDKDRSAHVVRDDAFGAHGGLLVRADGRQFLDPGHERREEFGLEDRFEAVHHADGTLDAHAGVDVVLLERLVGAFRRLVVLHEDVVPDLDVLAAMATGTALRAAGGLTVVDEHLGVRPAGAGGAGRPPPVVLLGQRVDALFGDAEALPDGD